MEILDYIIRYFKRVCLSYSSLVIGLLFINMFNYRIVY